MSFMPVTGPSFPEKNALKRFYQQPGSYGWRRVLRQIAAAALCTFLLNFCTSAYPAWAQASAQNQSASAPIQIVALGDSLTAGLGLPDKDAFVPRLEAALTAKGIAAVIANAGVSGDTASDGLARLDWSVPDGTQAVIVELGANDMLRGIKPEVTRDALDKILQRLAQRHIAVMLCGMRAAPNLGGEYVADFERIYPELAAKYHTLLYPFFLDGVAGNLKLIQPDGLHPNAAGVGAIVDRILPTVLQLIDQIHTQHPS
jgi:acyl-CoA thioesterase I